MWVLYGKYMQLFNLFIRLNYEICSHKEVKHNWQCSNNSRAKRVINIVLTHHLNAHPGFATISINMAASVEKSVYHWFTVATKCQTIQSRSPAHNMDAHHMAQKSHIPCKLARKLFNCFHISVYQLTTTYAGLVLKTEN